MTEPRQNRAGFWPTTDQQDLLEACLLEGDPARRAWERWKHADIDNLDQGSFRLLPLLSRSLVELGIDDPCLAKLKGVRRHFWVRNQVLFHHMGRLLQRLEGAGIGTLVLKGAPLGQLYYRDIGLRPMNDFDILIRPADRDKALQLLKADGWQPIYFERFELLSESYLSFATSHGFRDADRREFDLHWYLFPSCAAPGCDEELWDRAQPFDIGGVRTRTLSPADHLLHICAHGAAWNEIPPIRWIADAVTLLRVAAERIDWEALVQETRRHGHALVMLETLVYLGERFLVPVPEPVLAELSSSPHGAMEEFLLQAQNTPLSRRGLGMEYRLLRHAQQNWVGRAGVSGGLGTFLKVMQHTAKKSSLPEMLAYAARQGLKRLAREA